MNLCATEAREVSLVDSGGRSSTAAATTWGTTTRSTATGTTTALTTTTTAAGTTTATTGTITAATGTGGLDVAQVNVKEVLLLTGALAGGLSLLALDVSVLLVASDRLSVGEGLSGGGGLAGGLDAEILGLGGGALGHVVCVGLDLGLVVDGGFSVLFGGLGLGDVLAGLLVLELGLGVFATPALSNVLPGVTVLEKFVVNNWCSLPFFLQSDWGVKMANLHSARVRLTVLVHGVTTEVTALVVVGRVALVTTSIEGLLAVGGAASVPVTESCKSQKNKQMVSLDVVIHFRFIISHSQQRARLEGGIF